jgi:TonB-dependent receptor
MMLTKTPATDSNNRQLILRSRLSASVLALTAALAAGGVPAWASAATTAAVDADSSGAAAPVSDLVVTAKRTGTVEGALKEKQDDVAVTSIMSAEEISERPGATIVDVLSHLPGISTFSDMGLGQASTGQAEYITIRGIDSSYNAYTLNGVRAPQADPSSRALSLKMVPPYGIESVAVVKTPTPDMDGDAIGGIVDIRTPNAFDFSGPMLRATVNSNLSGFASELGAPSAGGGFQIEAARRFGPDDQFGIYVGAYYGKSNSAGEAVEALGYVPTLRSQEPAGLQNTVISQSTPQTNLAAATGGLSATGVRFDYYNNYITRFGGNIALDWRSNDTRLYLVSSYASYQDTSYDTQHDIIGAGLTAYGPTGTSATYDPTGTIPGSFWQSRNQDEHLATFKLGGESKLDRLTLTYDGSVGYSDIQEPNYVTASMYGVDLSNVSDGFTVNTSNPAHVAFQYNSPAVATVGPNNETTDQVWKYQGNNAGSSNLTYGGRMDAHYRVEQGVLDFVQAGVNIQIADRNQFDHPFFTNGPFGFGGGGQNFAILGPAGQIPSTSFFPFGPTVASLPGYNISFMGGNYPGPFKIYNPGYLTSQIVPLAYTNQFAANGQGNPGLYTQNDFNNQTVKGEEDVYATYVEANLKYHDWAAIVGLRYEDTDFDFSQWMDQTATTGHFQTTSRSYGEVLPSLLVTWRPDPSMVFRADIRESFARPAFGLFAAPISVSTNPLTNQIIGASEGNPNLKPATAINYDLAAELYGAHGDIIEISAYYKQIHNFIFPATVSGGLPATGSTSQTIDGILLSIPENGKDASLEGFELDVRHKLVGLPGLLDGFGVGGSLTVQHSDANPNLIGHPGNTWLPRAPELIYNLDLFYQKYGVRSDLSFQYTGLQLDGIASTGLDEYLQPQQSLDLSISYPIEGVLIAFSAKNLLNDIEFYKTLGKGTQYLGTQDGGGNGSWVETGRFFTLSASYRW